jgi:hypothetical protein
MSVTADEVQSRNAVALNGLVRGSSTCGSQPGGGGQPPTVRVVQKCHKLCTVSASA